MKSSSPQHQIELHITGMHCASCALLLERKLQAVPGVTKVIVNDKTGLAVLSVKPSHIPEHSRLSAVIHDAGYGLLGEHAPAHAGALTGQAWTEIAASLLIIFVFYKILDAFDLVSLAPSTAGSLSLGGIFVIGLVAGTSSCLAVTGGLLLALAAKHSALHRSESPAQKFKPLLQFNIARLVSYFVLGGVIALLGKSIAVSVRMTGYINVAVALVMLWLGLSILGFVRKGSFPIHLPKQWTRWIAGLSESDHPAAPLLLGALTFFLPCGFTQSLQLVALGSGTFSAGAVIMSVFALGTLPALLGISAVSSRARGKSLGFFLRFSGTLVVILSLYNLSSGLALSGLDLARLAGGSGDIPPPAAVQNNVQTVSMTVLPTGYQPSTLTIKAGIPVRWIIDGTQAAGCTSVMTIPALNISRVLTAGENIIEFTAPSRGTLAFMCSMGMVRGTFNVL